MAFQVLGAGFFQVLGTGYLLGLCVYVLNHCHPEQDHGQTNAVSDLRLRFEWSCNGRYLK
jgi:hypothetical protein